MKVLSIIPPFGFKKEGEKIKQKPGFMPAIGLSLIATILDNAGHEVRILDMQVNNLTEKELIGYIRGFNPAVVSMSILDATSGIVKKIINVTKTNFKDVKIICGGVHASMYPKETLTANENIDFLIHGEAEYTMRDLVDALENNTDIDKVLGVYYRKNGEIKFTGNRPVVTNLDEFPIPSRKFFDMKKYLPTPNQYRHLPATNMITARGCTYSLCNFCFESTKYVRDKGYRRISVERAIEEIKYLIKEYGIREIAFWDDEFLLGGNWVEEFCDAIIAEGIKITWSCYGKVNFVNPPILRKMRKAGCWNIFYGLESGNQELLNITKKGQTLDMIKNAVKWANDEEIEIRGSFILGLPTETPEMGKKTVDFALGLDLDYGEFHLNTPYGGTEMEAMCKSGKYGTYYGDEKGFENFTQCSVIFLPKDYESPEQLLKLRNDAYKKFYLRPKYFFLKLKHLRTREDFMRYLRGIKFLFEVRLLNKGDY